jgi:hypothetical protein
MSTLDGDESHGDISPCDCFPGKQEGTPALIGTVAWKADSDDKADSAHRRRARQDGTFWSAKASDYLRGYFHAAALAGFDLRAVAAWVSGADPHVPEQILAAAGARQWALTLAELRS